MSKHADDAALGSPARSDHAQFSSPWPIVGTVCVGAFMGQLDASIAQLVLPTLETSFHVGVSIVGWVALSYLLVLAATLPIFGRLADTHDRSRLYTGGFLLFVLGSGLCALAPRVELLIAARVVQALGAGLLQANSIAIITVAAGPRLRGRALGLQGAAQAVGLSAGPALGGLLIQNLGWRWVFLINVPVGLLGALLGWLILPRLAGQPQSRRFDARGALLLAVALTTLLLAVSEGRRWGAVSPLFLSCSLGAIVCLALFVHWERQTDAPLIDLSLFRSVPFTVGNVAGLVSYGVLFGLFFLLPFALEHGDHLAPLSAGLILTAVPIALGIVAPLAGGLSDRVGTRPLTIIGLLLVACALALTARVMSNMILPLFLALLLFGAGQGLFTVPNNSAIMGAAPPDQLGMAGGILNVMRSLGTSLGVAVAGLVLSLRLAARSGHAESTSNAPPHLLLASVHDTLLVLALLSLGAALISLIRAQGYPVSNSPNEV